MSTCRVELNFNLVANVYQDAVFLHTSGNVRDDLASVVFHADSKPTTSEFCNYLTDWIFTFLCFLSHKISKLITTLTHLSPKQLTTDVFRSMQTVVQIELIALYYAIETFVTSSTIFESFVVAHVS